jgi:hypothetical protein
LHEGVERVELFQEILAVQNGLLGTQMDPQFFGYRYHFIDVGYGIHRAVLLSLTSGLTCTTAD